MESEQMRKMRREVVSVVIRRLLVVGHRKQKCHLGDIPLCPFPGYAAERGMHGNGLPDDERSVDW
jgi:hypothetical protein